MAFIKFLTKLLTLFIFVSVGLSSHLSAQCIQLDSLLGRLRVSTGQARLTTLNALSEEYRKVGKNKEALRMADAAIDYARNIQDPSGEGQAHINRALTSYKENQNADQVRESFNKAIAIYRSRKELDKLYKTYELFGHFFQETSYVKSEYLDSSLKYYKNAFDYYKKNSKKEKASEVASHISEVYFDQNNESEALTYANESFIETDTKFSKAYIIKNALETQAAAQSRFIYFLMVGMGLMALLAVLLVRGVMQTRKANSLLEKQKQNLIQKHEEINAQKNEIEKQKQKIEEDSGKLLKSNQEMNRLNRSIMLQQHEIEMRNQEMGEKNEELKQQQEEILTQRDNLSKQADELEVQKNELQKSYKTITILSRIGQSITSSLNFKDIFDTLYGYINEIMPADGFRVCEYHPEKQEIEYKFNNESQRNKPLIRVSTNDTTNPAAWCIKHKRSILVRRKSDLQQFEGLDSYSINPVFNSMIYFPLFRDDNVIGAIGVYHKQEDIYNHRHIDMIKTLASYTTIAITNAETYEILNAAQAQLVESEKMAALGSLVAGVAHEINTPVGVCVTAASRLETKTNGFDKLFVEGKMKKSDVKDYLETAKEGNKILMTNLRRAADLVQSFKSIAVEQTSENRRLFNLKTYLEETILSLKPEFKNKPYQIELDSEDIEIISFAGPFSQIITNLVMNSLIHAFKGRESGLIKIKTQQNSKHVTINYSDNGNGMTPEVLERLYEPFFTTNREGGGSGLGMNIVYNLTVQKLGGKMNVRSQPGQGVHFTFEFPLELPEVIAN
jgi:signal transduction histidine kinase